MADKSHILTDQKLEEMEKRLSAIYSRAEKEIQKTADEYFSKFAKQDEAKRKLVEQGKLTEDEYKKWRKGKVMYGKRFTEMKEQCAKQLLNVNQTALAYVNGELPEVYAINYNAIAGSVDGVGGYSFTLVDADTVRNLAVTDTSLLPYKELDPAKDIPWNIKKINAETLQGILQGESMDKIAKRIMNVQEMNKESAIRSARTIVTNAECKGRQDSYQRAQDDGIILRKYWLATYDKRARDWHKEAGNKYNEDNAIEIDEFFVVDGEDMLHPGDSMHGASGHNLYNCRCSIASKVIGFKKAQVQKAMEGEGTALNGDKYAMNPKDINGVTRGEAMSFEDADGQAGNPKYRKGTGTAQNCQSCVVANEARRRGYNVSAQSYTKNKTAEMLSQNPRIAWVDPKTGDVPDFVPWDYRRTYDKKSYRAFLDENVKAGERYTLQFNWGNASGGHIISAERDARGALRLYDPQTGKIYDKDWSLDDLMGRMSYTDRIGRSDPPKLLRVDNLAFREDVTRDILEEGAKVWTPTDDLDDWIPF